MKFFDAHIHCDIDRSVQESLESFRKIFDINDVSGGIFLSLPHVGEKGETDFTQNVKCLFYKKYFAPEFYAFAGLEHNFAHGEKERSEDFLRQAELYARVGFDGMKMLEGKPNIRRRVGLLLSDPSYDKYYSFLEEAKMPLVLHNADPEEFWDITKLSEYAIKRGWYNDETNLKKAEMFEDVISVLKKHPRLRLTLAHFGFCSYDIRDAERFLGDFEYTSFDVTPGGEQLLNMRENWETWHEFFTRYQDRIKYGTDTYNFPLSTEAERAAAQVRPDLVRRFFLTDGTYQYYDTEYTGVKIEKSVAEKIFYKNALRELGAPKDTDTGWLFEKLEKLEKYYRDREKVIADLAFMRKTLCE